MSIKPLDSFENLFGSFVTLKNLSSEDSKFCVDLRNSERAKFLNSGSISEDEQNKWLDSRPENELNYVVCDKNLSRVGLISLIEIDFKNKRAEPARFIMTNEKSALRTKMILESLFLIYSLSFKDLGLEKLHGVIAKSNVRMIKLQESLGMEIEGVLLKHNIINGDFEDLVLVSLFKKKFEDYSSILLQKFLYNK